MSLEAVGFGLSTMVLSATAMESLALFY